MWTALTIVAVIALVFFLGRWSECSLGVGGLGVFGGLITAAVYYFIGSGFHWSIVWKWIVVCVDAGAVIEVIVFLGDRKEAVLNTIPIGGKTKRKVLLSGCDRRTN